MSRNRNYMHTTHKNSFTSLHIKKFMINYRAQGSDIKIQVNMGYFKRD